MDPASQALAQNLPPNVSRTYAALAEHCDVCVSATIVWYRDNGRPSRQTKTERQQYLTPSEENALVMFVLRMAALGSPVRIKDISPLAFSIARRWSPTKAIKLSNKNWPQAFAKRHSELSRRRNRAMDWNRHDNNIFDKIKSWFGVTGPELCSPNILSKNVYNMDETGSMLSMLDCVKVLINKNDRRDYKAPMLNEGWWLLMNAWQQTVSVWTQWLSNQSLLIEATERHISSLNDSMLASSLTITTFISV